MHDDDLRLDGDRRQTDDAPVLTPAVFCVVLHDVAGLFQTQVQEIVQQVGDLVDGCFACGMVPFWHGKDDKRQMADLVSVCGECEEWMIHGMTHRRERGGRLVSWLTNGADEFGGLRPVEIQERVAKSQERIRALTGPRPMGMVAPCWRLPVSPHQLQGIDYVMGYNGLVSCCSDAGQVPLQAAPLAAVPLASWSYDWGRFGSVASVVNIIPAWRFQFIKNVVPCVVIHPADVGRGWLPVAVHRIQKLLDLGYQPVTPQKLMLVERVSAL